MRLPGALHDASHLRPGQRFRTDAAIVGSGAGGAAVAAELSRQGMSVAVLEEGRSYAPADLVTRPSWAYRHLYQGRGVMPAKGDIYIPVAAGRAVGGSTFINSAICFRAQDSVLDEWVRDFGSTWTPQRMAPLFAEIERTLEVRKTEPSQARNNSLVVKRGAERLGWRGDFISRNAPGCVGCGVCQLGCPTGGKGSVDKNLLPAAIEHGAHVYSEVRATRILVDKGVARGVEAAFLDRDTEEPRGSVVFEADRVFVSAGAFGSPQLLQRSEVATSSGQVGENLHIHPGTACGAEMDEEVRYWDGVTQGYYVDLDHAILETFTATPELFWSSLPLGQMSLRKLKNLATCGCMIRDEGTGRVRFRGDGQSPAIEYRSSESDRRRFLLGNRALVRLFFAAGAKAVWPMLNTNFDAATTLESALAQLPDNLPVTKINPYGSHPQSTCRFGADRKSSVCKPSGETHDIERLYIADGSIFPTALGVNPQITIMAMATGMAREIARAG
jgi:choline dehydrogenase-like flavoprotein